MFYLHIIDTLMAGLVCGFLLVTNQFIKQRVWTLEEVAYSLDKKEMDVNDLLIRTVEVENEEGQSKDFGVCGRYLLSKTPRDVNRRTVKASCIERRRLQLLRSAVLWVY